MNHRLLEQGQWKQVRHQEAKGSGVLKVTAISSQQSGLYDCQPENDKLGKRTKNEGAWSISHS